MIQTPSLHMLSLTRGCLMVGLDETMFAIGMVPLILLLGDLPVLDA
jgi:hypothetical protein